MKMVIANWKMNKTVSEGLDYISNFIKLNPPIDYVKTIIAPSFVLIYPIFKSIENLPISLSGQNLFYEEKGPYTGEISGEALKSAGCKYVIIGHSERRKLFYESNEIIYKKYIAAKKVGLIPIICFGEELSQRKEGKTLSVIENQLKNYFLELDIILAYEPVWSIGTGIVPKNNEIEEVVKYLRSKFIHNITLLYGGSVDLNNIQLLLNINNIDGFLVGRASLDPLAFSKIIEISTINAQ